MAIDLSFHDVRRFVEGDQPKLLGVADKLLILVIISLPIALGPVALSALSSLTAKNELTKLGSLLLKSVTSKKDDDYVSHQKRMEIAYVIICYTAFFDSLDRHLPEDVRKGISLQCSEKFAIAKDAGQIVYSSTEAVPEHENEDYSDIQLPSIFFPHVAEVPILQEERLTMLYASMARGFMEFIKHLAYWEEMTPQDKKQAETSLRKAEKDAIRLYRLQYRELCMKSSSFSIWANLNEHHLTKKQISQLKSTFKSLIMMSGESVDIGFCRLQDAVKSLPRSLEIHRASQIAEALEKHYQARIDELIVEDRYYTEEGKPSLAFPRIRDAFIPQPYKVIRKTTQNIRLEAPESWEAIETRGDLGAFILSYLDSPYSLETPLVILGHPGSGKSLLTKVLAASLMSEQYTPIRVPLRNVDADATIPDQIQSGIEEMTHDKIESWATFARQFKNCPPVVILDGYDELLQASGKVFASYLQHIRHFQTTEAELGRPVRVIVTSRLTLIDKASIPEGTTILRLMEFDTERQKKWIEIWNSTNRVYFDQTGVLPFELPNDDLPDSESVLTLAVQPLLLLMLALYDSDSNQLKHSRGLKKTDLYDDLLRRFVWREQAKDTGFIDKPKEKQTEDVDRDMQRLGVAAIGMYNRRKLHIVSAELEEDLKFFKLEREVVEKDGRQLTQADMLLGSFFFVHKSKAKLKMDHPEILTEIAAFEFLHNTFGEFLTADFILQQLYCEIQTIIDLSASESLRGVLDQRLESADEFSSAWYACLAYTPLFERPVVLEMLVERATQLLSSCSLDRQVFLTHFDTILRHHLKQILCRQKMASIMTAGVPTPFEALPLLGHIATYSLNLVILRTVLSIDGYEFDEGRFEEFGDNTKLVEHEIEPKKDRARPWDRLSHVWQSWFPLDRLGGLTAIFNAKRIGSLVLIKPKATLDGSVGSTRFEGVLTVSLALADGVSAGLVGLVGCQGPDINNLGLSDFEEMLAAENIDAKPQILLRRTQSMLYARNRLRSSEGFDKVRQILRDAIDLLPGERTPYDVRTAITLLMYSRAGYMWPEIQEYFSEIFYKMSSLDMPEQAEIAIEWFRYVRYFTNHSYLIRFYDSWIDRFFHGIEPRMVAETSPELALEVLRFGLESRNRIWMDRLGSEWIDRMLVGIDPFEAVEKYPELLLDVFRLVRESGNHRWVERLGSRWTDLLLHIMHPYKVLALYPELLLEALRLLRESGKRNWMEEVGDEWLVRCFDDISSFEEIGRHPEIMLELFRFARDSDNQNWLDMIGSVWTDRFLDDRHPSGSLEVSSKLLLEILRYALETNNHKWMDRFGEILLERFLSKSSITETSMKYPELMLLLLRFALDSNNLRWKEHFTKWPAPVIGNAIYQAPFGFVAELFTSASANGETEFLKTINKYVKLPPKFLITE